eukprot:scaffold675_cov103-Cylindrotheca_fusiformis.AAC.4
MSSSQSSENGHWNPRFVQSRLTFLLECHVTNFPSVQLQLDQSEKRMDIGNKMTDRQEGYLIDTHSSRVACKSNCLLLRKSSPGMMTNGFYKRRQRQLSVVPVLVSSTMMMMIQTSNAFGNHKPSSPRCQQQQQSSSSILHMSSDWNDPSNDSNQWKASDDIYEEKEDWQEMMARKNDGSFWSDFEPSNTSAGDENITAAIENAAATEEEVDEAEAWLNTLASISADEVNFNMAEAERADKVRQMQEWGFDDETIFNTFGVAVDDALEQDGYIEGMKEYVETGYLDDEDWKTVESHAKVEKDPDTGEPIRQQMVYVDEHTCIGCTNCAMIAQSTFFMDGEHGRARVFQQWGDDDETVQIAIETWYVDFDEEEDQLFYFAPYYF